MSQNNIALTQQPELDVIMSLIHWNIKQICYAEDYFKMNIFIHGERNVEIKMSVAILYSKTKILIYLENKNVKLLLTEVSSVLHA